MSRPAPDPSVALAAGAADGRVGINSRARCYGFLRLPQALVWLGLAFGHLRLAIGCHITPTLVEPWGSLGVALGWLWGGFEVALYSGVYAEYMPSIWLYGGFGLLHSAFCL